MIDFTPPVQRAGIIALEQNEMEEATLALSRAAEVKPDSALARQKLRELQVRRKKHLEDEKIMFGGWLNRTNNKDQFNTQPVDSSIPSIATPPAVTGDEPSNTSIAPPIVDTSIAPPIVGDEDCKAVQDLPEDAAESITPWKLSVAVTVLIAILAFVVARQEVRQLDF